MCLSPTTTKKMNATAFVASPVDALPSLVVLFIVVWALFAVAVLPRRGNNNKRDTTSPLAFPFLGR